MWWAGGTQTMTSKKTYEAVAKKFSLSKPYVPQGDDADALTKNEFTARVHKHAQWSNDVVVIADVFSVDNPRFDRMRFYRACGVALGAHLEIK
jgi:hypothetical protein